MPNDALKRKLESLLLEEHSRARTDKVAELIGGNPDRFEIAWDIFCNGNPPLPQRMAWVISVVTDAHPSIAARYAASVAARLPFLNHSAEIRAALHVLMKTPIPRECMGDLLECLYPWLQNANLPAATRVYSMQVLYNISEMEPALKPELAIVIETLRMEASPAFQARARHLLPKLKKEIAQMEREMK
jgi:hypothetical protein